jgi:hypothetical protein
MNWFKQLIVKWVREDWDSVRHTGLEMGTSNKIGIAISKSDSASIDSDPILHFKVFNAVGGKIVEFRRYDRKTDRSDCQVYIIGKDEDFGEKIAKISTLEVMR